MGQLQRQDVQGASVAAGVPGFTPGYLEASAQAVDQTAILRTMAPGTHTAVNPINSGHALQQEVQNMIATGCEGEYNAEVTRTMDIFTTAEWAVSAEQPSGQRTSSSTQCYKRS